MCADDYGKDSGYDNFVYQEYDSWILWWRCRLLDLEHCPLFNIAYVEDSGYCLYDNVYHANICRMR